MRTPFAIGGAIVVWIATFGATVFAASQGVNVNIAHAFIFANFTVCVWFVSCAMAEA